jgi:hypothetical protein
MTKVLSLGARARVTGYECDVITFALDALNNDLSPTPNAYDCSLNHVSSIILLFYSHSGSAKA